jgi:hypothetical protein
MTDRSNDEWIRRIILANEKRFRQTGKYARPIPFAHLYDKPKNKEPRSVSGSTVGDPTAELQASLGSSLRY